MSYDRTYNQTDKQSFYKKLVHENTISRKQITEKTHFLKKQFLKIQIANSLKKHFSKTRNNIFTNRPLLKKQNHDRWITKINDLLKLLFPWKTKSGKDNFRNDKLGKRPFSDIYILFLFVIFIFFSEVWVSRMFSHRF